MSILAPGAARIDFQATLGDLFLLPGPLDLFGLNSALSLEGLEEVGTAVSNFGLQRAVVARARSRSPSINYHWTATSKAADADWLWVPPDHPLSRASPELASQIAGLVEGMGDPAKEAVIMSHVASSFRYGHGNDRFTDGTDSVPMLSCGLTRGSCVDIHTYAVAALRSAGLRAAYVAGVFWAEGDLVSNDMHCWVVTESDALRFWDISHDVIVGRDPQPDLSAKPGHRLPFSIGRGQRFVWQDREVEISHFALPHRLSDAGAVEVTSRLTRLA